MLPLHQSPRASNCRGFRARARARRGLSELAAGPSESPKHVVRGGNPRPRGGLRAEPLPALGGPPLAVVSRPPIASDDLKR
jgi:hypothetical protein